MSFRLKTILGIAVIEILLLSLLVFSGLQFLRNSNEEQLISRADSAASLFATMTRDAVVAMDLATLDELVLSTASTPGISYLRVRSQDGFVMSEQGPADVLARPFVADATIADTAQDRIFDTRKPIIIAGQTFGFVELGLDTTALEVLMVKARGQLFGVAFIEVILVGIFGWILGRLLTRQLDSLRAGARALARGDLGRAVKVVGNDELAETATSFNKMSAALKQYADDLEAARRQADDRRLRAETVLQDAIDSLSAGVVITDADGQVLQSNKAFYDLHGLEPDQPEQLKALLEMPDMGDVPAMSGSGVTKTAEGRQLVHAVHPLSSGGEVRVDTDITSVMEIENRNRQLERDLMHSQKMESIGTLAGGIAHEINTPIQYIASNLRFMEEALQDLSRLIDACETRLQDHPDWPDMAAKADLAYLREELPLSISQSLEGVDQVSHIVLAMKEFAWPGSREKTAVDVNRVVERASAICRNEWKSVAELDLQCDANLPAIMGIEGDLNQVVLNMMVNAAHAIEEQGPTMGKITITTRAEDQHVLLSIADTGAGMPESVQSRIFDPFFTTKDVGKGSGQGLAISHDIVVNKHNGKINVDSQQGAGTVFTIWLPLVGHGNLC